MDDITELPPGRRLDALVAEKVMGWREIAPGSGGELFGIPPGAGPEAAREWVPAYSTDIGASFALVEEMRERGWQCVVHHTEGLGPFQDQDDWEWRFDHPDGRSAVYATLDERVSTPLAICRAALAAAEAPPAGGTAEPGETPVE